ncbi:MAG: 4'-phosphopantetheinyl transferase superfamily protein [Gemmatimonadota bacterium]|nr:4'-phosphopantetheinyl transferase superfamily protein [Gemmatimonadota bacterium]MDH3426791.1 4'-phosphopantetheinyl transferase superfamily protein [Gemmatimonadota bacterium]
MPVGNDVVDLHDPGNQPGVIHPRFDQRVFTDEELSWLEATPPGRRRHALRWTLWAAKESVFKLVRQRDTTAAFRPRDFAVRLTAADGAEVSRGSAVYLVELDATGERVHAVARDVGRPRPVAGISRSERCPDAGAVSALVRAEAANSVGERLGIEPAEIQIRGKIPQALRHGKRLPVDVSLSHHGRFRAHAVAAGP